MARESPEMHDIYARGIIGAAVCAPSGAGGAIAGAIGGVAEGFYEKIKDTNDA